MIRISICIIFFVGGGLVSVIWGVKFFRSQVRNEMHHKQELEGHVNSSHGRGGSE